MTLIAGACPVRIAARVAALVVPCALAACGGGSSQSAGSNSAPCTDGTTVACYTGPAGTEGVGVCHAGLETCSGGAFGSCVGEAVPSPETCNGLDDDCNGTVDDGGATASCSSGVCAVGACQAPTCTDGVKNGQETGIDCGGPVCPRCAVGDGCLADSDCQSGMCFASLCRADLDGCTPGTATDLTAQASVTITFPVGTTFAYDMPCIKVKANTVVTFSGMFAYHPLQGGAVLNGTPTPATSGPFVPATNTGTSKDFTLSAAGSYPYYCQVHGSLGMDGAIFVVP